MPQADNNENQGINKIVICMGSSCFTRGNNKSVEIIKKYLEEKGIAAEVSFVGSLCHNKCKSGPIILVNDQVFERVSPQSVTEILDHVLAGDES